MTAFFHHNDKVPFWFIRPTSDSTPPPACLSSRIQHRACPQGVFPPSMKSPPDVETRRGIDHVITVLQQLTVRIDLKHGAARMLH